jgi:mitochondrial import inner membrane translocase subunit TIM17
MGAIGGGIWHGVKGARNSPRVSSHIVPVVRVFEPEGFAQGERLVGAVSTIKARAPVTGGNFGVWGKPISISV